MLAPIRRPGRSQRGGDTVVIHGSQTPLLVKSENEAEIDEDESEEDGICNDVNGGDEEDEKKEESERIGNGDTPVPPRFTKAVIWT